MNPVPIITQTNEYRLETVKITEDLVATALSKIRLDKSSGPDEISPRLLVLYRQAIMHYF